MYDGLKFESEEDRKDIIKVLQVLGDFCFGQTNVFYERYTFNKREQEVNETIDSYVAALRTLVKTCKFEDLKEDYPGQNFAWDKGQPHTEEVTARERFGPTQMC